MVKANNGNTVSYHATLYACPESTLIKITLKPLIIVQRQLQQIWDYGA